MAPRSPGLDLLQRVDLRWVAAAVAIFAIAIGVQFYDVLAGGLREVVPTSYVKMTPLERAAAPLRRFDHLLGVVGPPLDLQRTVEVTDHAFAVWAVSRNAWTFLNRPVALFDAEPCAPAERTLALGHPVITHGLLAAPALLLTDEPIAAYDLTLMSIALFGAIAMFLLVRRWTGVPAAGIAAGLLYAFHGSSVGLSTYPFITDFSFALFALFLLEHFFEDGRWRDALLAAACCALQLAVSFYAFFGSLLIALPFGLWFVARHGVRGVPAAPAATALVLVGLAGAAVFGPYLSLSASSEELLHVSRQSYAAWAGMLPGRYVGWLVAVLAFIGLVRPPATGSKGGDPRLPALAAVLLVALMATGGSERAEIAASLRGDESVLVLPNLYAALSGILPGLDSIRSPVFLAAALHPPLCVLAGIGAAALLRAVPPRVAPVAAALLLAVVWLDTLHPELVEGRARTRYRALSLRPAQSQLDFFEALQDRGNEGPIFELPITRDFGYALLRAGKRVLLTSYHHRRTSGCYNSFIPPETRALTAVARALPTPSALARVREMGFTTVVIHHSPDLKYMEALRRRFTQAAEEGSDVRVVHMTEQMSAFAVDDG